MSCILRASPRPRSGRFAAGARTSPGPGHTPAAAPPPLRPQQLLSLLFSSSRGAGSRHRSRGAGRGAFTRGGAAPSRAGLCRPHPRQPRAGGAPGTMSTGMRYKSKLLNPGEAPGPEGGDTKPSLTSRPLLSSFLSPLPGIPPSPAPLASMRPAEEKQVGELGPSGERAFALLHPPPLLWMGTPFFPFSPLGAPRRFGCRKAALRRLLSMRRASPIALCPLRSTDAQALTQSRCSSLAQHITSLLGVREHLLRFAGMSLSPREIEGVMQSDDIDGCFLVHHFVFGGV